MVGTGNEQVGKAVKVLTRVSNPPPQSSRNAQVEGGTVERVVDAAGDYDYANDGVD